MSKIITEIEQCYRLNKPTVSFEFFPAKTEEGISNLLARIEDMNYRLHPTFVTLTWRSAFKNEDLWLKIGSIVQSEFGVNVLLHLTCHLPVQDLKRILSNVRKAGIRNILALRGDPPIGVDNWSPVEGGLKNAVDLIQLIRQEHGDWFCIACAAYPEVHTECWNHPDLPPSEQAQKVDLYRLKEKVDAGADFIITQFFYDIDVFEHFYEKCVAIGIQVPILPGYLPIQNYNSFCKFTTWCKTGIPPSITESLKPVKDNDEAVKEFGIEETIRVCRTLLKNGHKSLHFYTMNLEGVVTKVIQGLGMLPRQKDLAFSRPVQKLSRIASKNNSVTVSDNDLSSLSRNTSFTKMFRPVKLGSHKNKGNLSSGDLDNRSGNDGTQENGLWENRTRLKDIDEHGSSNSLASALEDEIKMSLEEIRPIFWANRQTAYLSRTNAWDEFPNGRWGDFRSPAYGELSSYYLDFKKPKVDRLKIWGKPTTYQEVYDIFVRFISGEVPTLPWCEQAIAAESSLISSDLLLLNQHGFLTINSQPAVNGAPSSDPDVGWGGNDGYVYQKSYVEFFCSSEKLDLLLKVFEKSSSLSYHAINRAGDKEYTNRKGNSVNALTWGVFPGQEIKQPTIVDPYSFKIWSKEAFELWMTQWANAYEKDSPSYQLIETISNSFFLVNVVDNDYSNGNLSKVFDVFKETILNTMSSASLLQYVQGVQQKNSQLAGVVKSVTNMNSQLKDDLKELRGEMIMKSKEVDNLKLEIHNLKLNQVLSNQTLK